MPADSNGTNWIPTMLKKTSFFQEPATRLRRNKWDIFSIFFVFTLILLVAWIANQLGGTIDYHDYQAVARYSDITLSAWQLPFYAAATTFRMFIALFISLVISLIFGTWAAKNKRAEQVIIPVVDILQSIPILGFLAITITMFLTLMPNTLWGAQAAIIFGVFTAQVWNMLLSIYQSLKTVPKELHEATQMYQLTKWQRFWKLEIPFAMPGLIWNMMISMSASWFMVVASESLVINFGSDQSETMNLPGIGTFIDQANNQANYSAVGLAILAMLIVIVLYDQLFFRPLVKWSEKFIVSDNPQETVSTSWFLNVLQRSRFMQMIGTWFAKFATLIVNLPKKDLKKSFTARYHLQAIATPSKFSNAIWKLAVMLSIAAFTYLAWHFIYHNPYSDIGFQETLMVFGYGLATLLRVAVLIIITSLIWVPIGIWIGMRPKFAAKVQPYAQIAAAFPVNLFYGVFGAVVFYFNLNFNIWCIVLMALGTQWYILFNVIAGASAIPTELKMAAGNLQLKGMVKWFRYLFPAVMPFYVTGAITASGGAWNASIVCEYINWGAGQNSILQATGIGNYIANQYHLPGNHTANVALGVIVMCIIVVLLNKFFWRRLYQYAEKRFSMNM